MVLCRDGSVSCAEICLLWDYVANISKISLIVALYAVKHIFALKVAILVCGVACLAGTAGLSKNSMHPVHAQKYGKIGAEKFGSQGKNR